MQQLRLFLEQSDKEGEPLPPPPRLPHELDSIAQCYYNLSLKLQNKAQGTDKTKDEAMQQK
jgi:hypothetical protein